MARLKLLIVIGGIGLGVYGVQEWRLSSAAAKDPQTITCADLSAKGPGGNAHVAMTDFFPCVHSYVYESRSKNDTSKWSKVWLPVVPVDSEYARKFLETLEKDESALATLPPPTDIRVLVKSTHVRNEDEMGPLFAAPKLDGLIVNKIESIGSDERKILEESYPGIDFTRCYILDHDRKPASTLLVAGALGGGLALILGGVGWLVAGRRS